MRKVFLLLAFFVGLGVSSWPWPEPVFQNRGSDALTIDPNSFTIKPDAQSNTALLQAAITRYMPLIFPFDVNEIQKPDKSLVAVTLLTVSLVDTTANPDLQLGVDETYSLSVNDTGAAQLSANTIWGALRGLETFSQLVDFNMLTMSYIITDVPVDIQDKPRFPWRGLMIDTARHYLSPDTIYRTIDALSYNKFNTLHWHAVDAESFPMECVSYPLLYQEGAYDETLAIYTQDFMADVVDYGYQRGIRVVVEFDVPGHAYSWGYGYPQVRAQCPSSLAANINNYPLDPSNNLTLTLLDSFVAEMVKVFTDKTLHLGGDEVVYSCWTQDPTVQAWMQSKGYTTGTQVLQYFEDAFQTLSNKYGKKLVLWQDVYDNGIRPPKNNTIFEVWEDSSTLAEVVAAGYQGILAAPWYLDKQQPNADTTHYEFEDTWLDFYNAEPYSGIPTANQNLIIGGEGAMFGEQVDDTCFDERVWPRASAIGERLWSTEDTVDTDDAKTRLIDFRCRVSRRGIRGGPIAPDYCPLSLTPSREY